MAKEDVTVRKLGLGRWNWPDPRDRKYSMPRAAVLPKERKVWQPGQVLDQDGTPQCVAYSWKQLLQTTPTEQGHSLDEKTMYDWCQANDEWPGEAYDGTSVRAGAKFLEEQGWLREYRWAWKIADVLDWVVRKGPVVLGTAWLSGMYYLREDGVCLPQGDIIGGHAYLCIGWEPEWEAVVCVNSWGNDWGKDGIFYFWAPHLDWLLQNGGEACAPTEIHKEEQQDGNQSGTSGQPTVSGMERNESATGSAKS